MAKDTNRRIEANLKNPEFRKLLKKTKLMVQLQQSKKADAAYHILKHMDLEKNENDPFLFWHIPDRHLAEMIDVGNATVSNARQRLIQERRGIKKVIKNVDTSKAKVIGSGNQFVYLYYFPTYRLNSIYYIKYIDDSHETPIYVCNIGSTRQNVKKRVSQQIGQQLPEKARIALVIKTDDCEALETEIHDELKRRGAGLIRSQVLTLLE